jgi:hypothetical protein
MRAPTPRERPSSATSQDAELVVAAVLMGVLVVLTAWAAPLIAI